MRGLTPAERQELIELDSPPDSRPEGDLTAEEVRLIADGRAKLVTDPDWVYPAPTDLGRLALRVCPVGEP